MIVKSKSGNHYGVFYTSYDNEITPRLCKTFVSKNPIHWIDRMLMGDRYFMYDYTFEDFVEVQSCSKSLAWYNSYLSSCINGDCGSRRARFVRKNMRKWFTEVADYYEDHIDEAKRYVRKDFYDRIKI